MATERRLLEESSDEFMILYFVYIFLAQGAPPVYARPLRARVVGYRIISVHFVRHISLADQPIAAIV